MLLKNNLYTITAKHVEKEKMEARYELELIPTSIIYQAHFPGNPITPGVCILQMGKELVEDALQKKLNINFVKNVKFLSVLSPRQCTAVNFLLRKMQVMEEGKEVKVQILVEAADEMKAKISMVLRESEVKA